MLLSNTYYDRDAADASESLQSAVARWEHEATRDDLDALFNLSVMHLSGDVLARDSERGFLLAVRGMQLGDERAEKSISKCLIEGHGVDKDIELGIHHLHEAAVKGEPKAQSHLAARYLAGEGVPLDENEGQSWMMRAAHQGDPLAQYNVALLSMNRLGESPRYAEVIKWAMLSTFPRAKMFLRDLRSRLPSTAYMDRGRSLATAWKPVPETVVGRCLLAGQGRLYLSEEVQLERMRDVA